MTDTNQKAEAARQHFVTLMSDVVTSSAFLLIFLALLPGFFVCLCLGYGVGLFESDCQPSVSVLRPVALGANSTAVCAAGQTLIITPREDYVIAECSCSAITFRATSETKPAAEVSP